MSDLYGTKVVIDENVVPIEPIDHLNKIYLELIVKTHKEFLEHMENSTLIHSPQDRTASGYIKKIRVKLGESG